MPPQQITPPTTTVPPRAVLQQLGPASVTYALIGLNVLVFLAMLVSGISFTNPTVLQLLQWGANFGPLDRSGQWWRLLTACFLHIGFLHIAFNMYVLYQVGPFTERLFGSLRYLAVYLAAGVGGNLLGLWLHPMTVSAGASGAIFGVYGGLLAFLLKERAALRPEAVKSIGQSALIFIAFNLFYGAASAHTDLTAHIGGLATGFLAGLLLARPLPRLPAPATNAPLQ